MNVNDIELWIMKYDEWDEEGLLVGRILVWGEYCVIDRDLTRSNDSRQVFIAQVFIARFLN